MADQEKKSILIIEDDKFFRDMVARKLEKEGFSVFIAQDGKEAMSILSEKSPSLVILDLILPEMDGFDLIPIIKSSEKTKDTPILILSNLGQADEIKKALSLGANEFLIKVNFNLDQILEKIRSFVG